MSEGNVAAAKRIYEARSRGDVDALLAECHPGTLCGIPTCPSFAGSRFAATTGFGSTSRRWTKSGSTCTRRPSSSSTPAIGWSSSFALARAGGAAASSYTSPVAHVLSFENGRAVESVTYMDRAEGLEAAGLSS